MCGGSKWKREKVADHKFDFVDTREFTDSGFVMRLKYTWLYIIVLKSFMVYILDIFTAITMLSTTSWSNEIFNECTKRDDGCIFIPFSTGKWLFVGCIIFSFLLLAYETRKAKKIIASRDISYAFTNVMANNYYSLRSYDHFCFFDHISNSTKTSDDFAFFVFFTFKSWKRVLLADGPRQTINGLTLYAIFLVKRNNPGDWLSISKWFDNKNLSTSLLTVTTFLTVLVFAGSLLLLVAAGICYFPLLCHIQGNLKEYCCHKVDKRIEVIIERRRKQRLADAAKIAQKEAKGDFSHLKNKKGEMIAQPLPQPTLPNLSIDDDLDDIKPRTPAPYTQDRYYNSDKNSIMTGEYPPPMPAYNPYSTYHNPGSHPHFQQSSVSITQHEDQPYPQHHYHGEDSESITHLASSAAPFSQHQYPERSRSAGIPPGHPGAGGNYDSHDVYQGRANTPRIENQRRSPPTSGLAYDDTSAYPAYGVQPASSDNPYISNGAYQSRGGYAGNDGYGHAM